MAGHQIVAGLYPAAAVAFFTGVADAALADEIDLGVPLAISAALRAARVKIAGAQAHRYAVERVRIGGAGAEDDVGGVGHERGLARRGRLGKQENRKDRLHRCN